ncbi:ABC transporter substrate-binding protein [Sinorhizobium mexicanum]|uniref:ABC transporter substrate-binding protein n=1 Tax=Sinorhizobium mexicanum TaxID=375549 RepID=A0A859QE75_9HYPH|nr:ABC transporter substrate-binding protein [Sinorhizobium mexicanum]MBP1886356.1 NitT/TauT family transport system substrate-binding protein [Sinorhizobium mexicanum]QLL64043.1 ABC transporter substrate-binding protein [Sinorhizobium mexicanum]
MQIIQSRRSFLASVAAAGAAGLTGAASFAAGAPLETSTIRLAKIRGICIAPQYVAEELLRLEGFTDIRYVMAEAGYEQSEKIARGDVDFSLNFAAPLALAIDAGDPITLLAGVHPGCFELFGDESIRGITDLKGKTVGIQGLGSTPHVFVTSMAAYVGLDPQKDIRWVTDPSVRPMELFIKGKVDAFLGFPPEPQELRARNIGHVVVNSAIDRPWSQYFCCMLAGNADFVRNNPVATKHVLRAILRAADLCVAEPRRVARQIVDGGFTDNYDYALQTMSEVPYGKWRDYDPEDTIRFYALRLHESGMVKSSPQEIIANGTDWRFLNEVKRELKT